ncbi:MAG TPA: GAF domain-containing protein [Streptosporangiaceae bacterium]|jgi:signal transduction histidine kinase|nr:GAF domain-containing protein [Streptosporangiaceae bacterium]
METASGTPGVLPNLQLDELLAELQSRMQAVLATRDRMHGLLQAVVTVGSGLDLETTLRRIVEAAVGLVDAKYGALGMISEGQRLVEFIPVGLEEAEIRKIDHWPEGRGLLGLLIHDPRPLRLADISQHPESSGFPRGHPPMSSFLGVPVRVRGTVAGNLYLTEKRDGGEFTEDDEAVLTALGAAAGVAIENARLYDEAQRQQRWLRASAEVTTSLLSGTDPGQVLASLTRQARELSGADLVWLSMPDEEGLRHTIEYAEGDGAAEARGLVVPADRSLALRVMLSGEPLTLDDLTDSDDIAWLERDLAGQVDHVMAFPLGPPGNVRGVLHVGRRRGGLPFPPAIADLVASFAAQAGVALELAARRRDAERLSLFEDRDRIARDLHDLVIQRLYATGMSLEGMVPMITKPEVTNRIRNAVDSMDETIKDIRATIFALQSRAEDQPPNLQGEIVSIVDQMTPMLGFSPSLRLGQGLSGPVAADAAECMLTALREALSNAARHAHATRVDVSADVDAARNLTLRVVDNGVGIPPSVHRSGLRNLAQRAEKLGGELRLGPAGATGTELVWRVPRGPR